MEYTRSETVFDGKQNDWMEFAIKQAEFYKNAGQYIINVKMDIEDIDNEIASYNPSRDYSNKFRDMLIVKDGDKYLKVGKDFTVSYSDNKTISVDKNAKIKVIGKGNYKGSISKEFVVVRKYLNQEGVKLEISDVAANDTKSNICKPVITITDTDGKKLKAGTDYDLINYTYVHDTIIKIAEGKNTYREGFRSAGDSVRGEDIIPVGTKIKATIFLRFCRCY